jgi:hypothetical protein
LLGSGASLVAIQQLQLEQGMTTSNDKRSFRDIQEEEQARQAESEFLKWWSAEEERIKAAEQTLLETASRTKKQKSPKGKSGGGLSGHDNAGSSRRKHNGMS